jgi:hypothetical protein
MTKQGRLSTKEREAAANAVAALGAYGIFTTGDPEEWVVHPELIAEAWRTHCSCIPNAMSGWSETVPLPSTWAIWWISRMTHAKHESDCGTGGDTSVQKVLSQNT